MGFRIGWDLDNVSFPFVQSFLSYAGLPDIPAKDWAFYEEHGLTLSNYLAILAQGVDEGYVFTSHPPIDGCIESIQRLRSAGHTIHLVTDRTVGKRAALNTVAWLQRFEFPCDSLTISKDKTIIRTDAFLDDKPQNVDELRAVGCAAFLLDCGRRDQIEHPYLVGSYEEFEQRIRDIEDGFEVDY